jgi:multiple sugar transport system substrate-binding protein
MDLKRGVSLIIFFLLLTPSFVLFAAGEQEAGAKPKEIELTCWMGSWWKDQGPKIEEAYRAANPNVKLEIKTYPINGYIERAISSIVGSSPPDVLALGVSMIGIVAGHKLLQPIHGVREADFAPALWDAGVIDNMPHLIPYRSENQVMYFNRDMFDRAGLAYPTEDWTWQSFLEMAKKLTLPGAKQYGFALSPGTGVPACLIEQIAPMVWAHGGELVVDRNCVMDEPNAIKGLLFWSELFTKHRVTPTDTVNYTCQNNAELFQAKQLAMLQFSSAGARKFSTEEAGLNFGVQLLPDKITKASGFGYAIPVGARHPKEARDYILWFTNAENLAELAIRLPARISAAEYPPWNSEKYAPMIRAGKYGRLIPAIAEWNVIRTIIIREMQRVLLGEVTVEEASRIIADESNKELNK